MRLNWNLETSRSGASSLFYGLWVFPRGNRSTWTFNSGLPSGDPADPESRAPDSGSKTGASPTPVQLPPIQQEYSSLQNRLHLLRTQRLIQTPVVQGIPDMSLANCRGKCTRRQELAILQSSSGKCCILAVLAMKNATANGSLNLDFRSTFAALPQSAVPPTRDGFLTCITKADP